MPIYYKGDLVRWNDPDEDFGMLGLLIDMRQIYSSPEGLVLWPFRTEPMWSFFKSLDLEQAVVQSPTQPARPV